MITFASNPQRIGNMLVLQETLNLRVHDKWREQDFPWHRAAWMEAAELMEHLGWKWWKKQEPDLAQAQLEIIDIWHFALSYALQSEGSNIPNVQRAIERDVAEGTGPLERGWNLASSMGGDNNAMRSTIEVMVNQCVGDGTVSPVTTLFLAEKLGLTEDSLYRQYVGKNVLNLFRQDHGYKEGTYRKLWRGLEDNKVVEEWQKAEPDWTPQQLMEELERSYGTE